MSPYTAERRRDALEIMISADHVIHITPVASAYQYIYPYSAMDIDSVKINTSLIMMEE